MTFHHIFEYRTPNTNGYNLYWESYHTGTVTLEHLKKLLLSQVLVYHQAHQVGNLRRLCVNCVFPYIWSTKLGSLMKYWLGKAEASTLVLTLKDYFNELMDLSGIRSKSIKRKTNIHFYQILKSFKLIFSSPQMKSCK